MKGRNYKSGSFVSLKSGFHYIYIYIYIHSLLSYHIGLPKHICCIFELFIRLQLPQYGKMSVIKVMIMVITAVSSLELIYEKHISFFIFEDFPSTPSKQNKVKNRTDMHACCFLYYYIIILTGYTPTRNVLGHNFSINYIYIYKFIYI